MRVVLIQINQVIDKKVWKLLKGEGFVYVGHGIMAKTTIATPPIYKEYLKDIIGGKAEYKLMVVDLLNEDIVLTE